MLSSTRQNENPGEALRASFASPCTPKPTKPSALLIGGKLIELKTLQINLPSVTAETLREEYLENIKRSINETGYSKTAVLPLSCQFCQQKFPNVRYLNRHNKTVHVDQHWHYCSICGRKFEEERYLEKHVKTIHENKEITKARRSSTFKCNVCSLRFHTAKSLKRHFCNPGSEAPSAENFRATVIYTRDKPIGKLYKKSRNLSETASPSLKHIHKCPVCAKTFSMKGSLENHMRVHDKLRPFACTFCTKRFPTKHALAIHERRHTGERPFGCPLCTKTFVEAGEVSKHVRFHTQEKPFKCHYENCGKGFARKGRLTEHIRTHTGEKFHACRVCLKAYPNISNCTRHEKEVHKYFEPREAQAHVKRVPMTTEPRPRTEEEIAADATARRDLRQKNRSLVPGMTEISQAHQSKQKFKATSTTKQARQPRRPRILTLVQSRNPVSQRSINEPKKIIRTNSQEQIRLPLPAPVIIKEEISTEYLVPEVISIKAEDDLHITDTIISDEFF